jgi:competence protein ComEC
VGRLRPGPGLRWWHPHRLRWLAIEALAISLAATLGTAPVVALHFHQVSLISPLANLLVVPLVSLLLFPLAASLLVLVPVAPLLADAAASLAGIVADGTAAINLLLARLPGAGLLVAPPGPGEFVLLYVATGLLLLGGSRKARAAGLAAGLAVALSWSWPWLAQRWDRGVQATLLDVGQGDATLLRLPGPFHVLVDTGGKLGSRADLAQQAILPFLRQARAGQIDLLVITHPHPDHYLGAAGLLAGVPVRRVWLPAGSDPEEERDEAWAALQEDVRRRGIPVERVDRRTLPLRAGAAEVRVLGPPPGGGGLSGRPAPRSQEIRNVQ